MKHKESLKLIAAGTVLIVSLSGCKTTEELREQEKAEAYAQFTKDSKECISYGAKVDTPEYTSCMLKLKELRVSTYNAGTMSTPTINTKPKTCIGDRGYVTCF